MQMLAGEQREPRKQFVASPAQQKGLSKPLAAFAAIVGASSMAPARCGHMFGPKMALRGRGAHAPGVAPKL